MTTSLEVTDKEAAAVQKTEHRVSLDSINQKVAAVDYLSTALSPHTTIAVVKLSNGYVVYGTSTPTDPENYNEELGRKFAYEDAIRKVWPLEGYLLREKLAA